MCGFLWSLTARQGLRDTGGGTSANFLHTPAARNKSAGKSVGKRGWLDKPFDKLPMARRKPLGPEPLSGRGASVREMLRNVNKAARTRGRHCVSPIHGHLDSNLLESKILDLRKGLRTDMCAGKTLTSSYYPQFPAPIEHRDARYV